MTTQVQQYHTPMDQSNKGNRNIAIHEPPYQSRIENNTFNLWFSVILTTAFEAFCLILQVLFDKPTCFLAKPYPPFVFSFLAVSSVFAGFFAYKEIQQRVSARLIGTWQRLDPELVEYVEFTVNQLPVGADLLAPIRWCIGIAGRR